MGFVGIFPALGGRDRDQFPRQGLGDDDSIPDLPGDQPFVGDNDKCEGAGKGSGREVFGVGQGKDGGTGLFERFSE